MSTATVLRARYPRTYGQVTQWTGTLPRLLDSVGDVTLFVITGIGQKKSVTDFWVLCDMNLGEPERFFVLSHDEMCKIQDARNRTWDEGYAMRHEGRRFDPSKGVDNVEVKDVKDFENAWSKIIGEVTGA